MTIPNKYQNALNALNQYLERNNIAFDIEAIAKDSVLFGLVTDVRVGYYLENSKLNIQNSRNYLP